MKQISISSDAFNDGNSLPVEHTCDGETAPPRSHGTPPPQAHRYFFKVYALDTTLSLKSGTTKSRLEAAISGHILAQGEVIGEYGR